MSEDYVRKEVFDAEVKRLESENLRNCEKFAYLFRQQDKSHRKDIEVLRVENEALKERLSDLRDSLNRSVTILALVITALGAAIAAVQILGG